ncbi:MAG TPA: hypothetical protein GX510_02470 [Firmicutes bacterium]|nr:hypothetical protein [Candidatus Fermentithermobacillaceae bacterium]
MLLLRSVTVKSRVTPGLKQELARDTQEEIRKLDLELRAIEEELDKRRAMGAKGEAVARLEKEKADKASRRQSLINNLEDIAGLEIGQEVVRGQVQGLVEVKPGDIWPEVLAAEIVIEDGVVLAVRDGRSLSVDLGRKMRPPGEPGAAQGDPGSQDAEDRGGSRGKEGR